MTKKRKQSAFTQIIVAVVIALLVGGSAPWWWSEVKNFFVESDTNESTPQTVPTPVEPETKTITACSHLSVTASWDGISARQETNQCKYSPPVGWRIINYQVQEHNKSNGSCAVSFDERLLTAKVRAKAHGSTFDQKRGWINVTVKAMIERTE